MLLSLIEAFLLAMSCSLDAFSVSFAYGVKKIRIPFISNQIINLICASILGISLLMGAYIRQYLPLGVTRAVCFSLLFILGIVKLLESTAKSILRTHSMVCKEGKQIKFSMFNYRFILNLYVNPECADVDASKDISPAEALALAVSLSLDGLAIGLGAAIGNINIPAVIIASLMTNMAAVALGCFAGNKMSNRLPFDPGFISGLMLIALALLKTFL